MKSIKQFVKYVFFFYACVITAYWVFVQPAYTNWGANPAEIVMKLPGDEFISANRIVSTRAIDIQASKEKYGPGLCKRGKIVVALIAITDWKICSVLK